MTIAHTIKEYIQRHYYDILRGVLDNHITSNPLNLGLHIGRDNRPNKYKLVSMNIKAVYVGNLPGDEISFDVIVEANISIVKTEMAESKMAEPVSKSTTRDYIENPENRYGSDIATTYKRDNAIAINKAMLQWFRIKCIANIQGGNLQSFRIGNPEIHKRQENTHHNPKPNNNLVPIIAKNHFDSIAQDFLSRFYPEALGEQPVFVDVDTIAKRMGLELIEAQLSKDSTIIGATVFKDCIIDIWCNEAHSYIPINVKSGTIIIDPNMYSKRNHGANRNAVIHECVHWFLHRKHQWLMCICDSDNNAETSTTKVTDTKASIAQVAAIKSCNVFHNKHKVMYNEAKIPKAPYSKTRWSELDWMEWQANGISPRILMPKTQAEKILAMIHRRMYYLSAWERLPHHTVQEAIIQKLAGFFGVSQALAKIRMLDLGYREIEGISTFVNDSYIGNHSFNIESKGQKQTYCISLADSLHQYHINMNFRNIINSNRFIYVDGHHVLDDQKYVKKSVSGVINLTDYAKQNIDECCLRFDLVINSEITTTYDNRNKVMDSRNKDAYGYNKAVLFKDISLERRRIPHFNPDKHNMELFNKSEDMQRLYYEVADELCAAFDTEQTFCQYAWKIISQKGVNKKVFEDKTLLSGKYYDLIKSNSIKGNPSIETVMSICIGLDLGSRISEQLLEKAGHKLNDSPLHVVYRKFLSNFRGRSLYECNEILGGFSLPLISKKEYAQA